MVVDWFCRGVSARLRTKPNGITTSKSFEDVSQRTLRNTDHVAQTMFVSTVDPGLDMVGITKSEGSMHQVMLLLD